MPSTVQSLLKYKALSSLYAESSYNEQTPLTDAFFVNPSNEDSDEYDLMVDPAELKAAPLNRRDGAARSLGMAGMDQKRGVLFRTFNFQAFGPAVMQSLKEPDSHNLDHKGAKEIARQTRHFRQRHTNLKSLVISKILTAGVVYWDRATGDIKESSGAGYEDVDFGVPAANKTNLGGELTVNIDNTAFDWWSLFAYMDLASAQSNCPMVTDIWVNAIYKEALRKNAQFIQWAASGGSDAPSVLRGDMIPNLFGKTWHFVGQQYVDSGGTMRPYIPTSKLVATPPPGDRSWIEAANGSTLVPTNTGLGGSIEEVLRSVQEVYGPYSYAKVRDNPVSVEQYAGDCFGLNFVNPKAIYMPTVTGY